MKKATASYKTEELRQFGARPRVMAVIWGDGLETSVTISETEIIECGHIIASRPAYFHDMRGQVHTLTLDNRTHKWQPGHANFAIPGGLWYGLMINLYTGFDLAGGGTEWILQYVGRIREIRDISDSFNGKHQAKIVSYLHIHDVLQTLIGAPDTDGTRQPFMSGYYKLRAELQSTTAAYAGTVSKSGTGAAWLMTTGDYSNTEDLNFVVVAESTGEIGTATIKWSLDGGNSWEKTGIVSATSISPIKLKNGLSIYFTMAAGNDLVAGDTFTFTAYAKRSVFKIPGAPFQEITNVYLNGTEIYDSSPDVATGELTIAGTSGFVDARVVKSETYNPVAIIEAILAQVNLTYWIDEVSFADAKRDLLDIQIGVCFEGVAAWKAIQAICSVCLIYFWIDGGKIYLSAYTGDE